MTNLLAILLSLAMLLTGASAPVAEPVSRTLIVSDLIVRHNEEEVELSPYISLGVSTDGAKSLFDFFVGNGDEAYLPFQLSVDESGLLLLNDNADVTLKIDKDKIDELLNDFSVDEDSAAVFELVGDYVSAYGELIKLMDDTDAMQAIQENADAIYDEMVDRGEAEEGTVEYDGEIFDVDIYEYDLTAAQLGALADAVYASDERLASFAEVYFRLLAAMPEDSGLNGFDSFEAILGNVGLTTHAVESISGSGLNVSDIVMTCEVPELEQPLEFVIHSVKYGDEKTSEMTADIDVEEKTFSLYLEAEQTGRDMEMNLTMTVNPAGANAGAGEIVETDIVDGFDGPVSIVLSEDEDEDEDEYEDDEIIDDEDEEDQVDGEGDSEDEVYFSVDFDRSYDEDTQTVSQSLSYSLDFAEQGIHAEFAIDGGENLYQLAGELDVGEEYYGFELNAEISDEAIDERIEAGEAVSLDDFDPAALVASVSEDAMKLYGDESVQKLISMAQSAMAAASAAEPDAGAVAIEETEDIEALPLDDDEDTLEDVPVSEVEPFVTPQFGWLPEGYEVQGLEVDDEYQNASCAIVNEETGDSIYVDVTGIISFADHYEHYVLGEDGSLEPIEGLILDAEVSDTYSMYSVNNGTLSLSVYSGSDTLTTEDIAHILSAMSFE